MPSNVSVGARTNFEQFILDKQKQLSGGNKSFKISPEQYNQAVLEFFGPIPLPQGAKEVSRTATELIYTLNGKQYRAFRNTNSDIGNVDIGRVETTLDSGVPGNFVSPQSAAGEQDYAPLLLKQIQEFLTTNAFADPNKPPTEQAGIQQYLDLILQNAQKLGSAPALGAIDPATQARLAEIDTATNARLDQQFSNEAANLAAELFGRGINRSSVAGDAGGLLLQGQGLTRLAAQSESAQRELQLRQFLAQLGQGNLALAGEELGQAGNLALNAFSQTGQLRNQQINDAINFLTQIMAQGLQRNISDVGFGQEQQRLALQKEANERGYGLQALQTELQDQQRRHANNAAMWNSIISAATAAIPFVGPLIGAIGGLGGSNIGLGDPNGTLPRIRG